MVKRPSDILLHKQNLFIYFIEKWNEAYINELHGLPFWAIHWPSLKPEYQRKWKGRNCMFFPSSAIFFSLKKNYLFKLFIYFMSKIIKHPDKSCVVITNDWTVCLCLFISGQSDTETCTRNSPSRGRQYNQNNISRNFLSFLSFSLSPLAHQTLKPKVTF